MTTQLDIYNEALILMGGKMSITTLEETSVEAKTLNRLYPNALRQLLETALWSFARKIARPPIWKGAFGLPGSTVPDGTWNTNWPDPPWSYSYIFPADCLRVRFLFPLLTQFVGVTAPPMSTNDAYYTLNPLYEFIVGSDINTLGDSVRTILTNVYQPMVVYTWLADDPDVWSPLFHQTLTYMLASKLALSIGGDKNLAQLNMQMAIATLQQAQVINANQGLSVAQSIPEWLRARNIPETGLLP